MAGLAFEVKDSDNGHTGRELSWRWVRGRINRSGTVSGLWWFFLALTSLTTVVVSKMVQGMARSVMPSQYLIGSH